MNIQKQVQKGFTLIELMIVIAIVGILAAIALPAYQDYTVRAKMAEPMAYMSELKASIAEFYSAQGEIPEDADEAGVGTAPNTEITYTVSYTSNDGGPIIYGVAKDGVFPGVSTHLYFVLSGITVSAERQITWKCDYETDGSPANLDGAVDMADYTKWLPANCRAN